MGCAALIEEFLPIHKYPIKINLTCLFYPPPLGNTRKSVGWVECSTGLLVRHEPHHPWPINFSVLMVYLVADLIGFTACSNGAQKDALPILLKA